jgi:hypothetical protein
MKKYFALGTMLLIVLLTIWWLFAPISPTPPTKAATPLAALTSAPRPAQPPPAAPTQSVASVDTVAAALTAATQSQDEARTAVKALVSDEVTALQAGNIGRYYRLFYSPSMIRQLDKSTSNLNVRETKMLAKMGQPPPPQISFEESNPDQPGQPLPGLLQSILVELQSVQNIEPKINAAGNEAEYTLDPSLTKTLFGHPTTLYFHKDSEDGQWHSGG